MTRYSTNAALLSLLIMPFVALAQEEGVAANEFESDPLQTVPVADEDTLELLDTETNAVTEEQLTDEFARYRRLIGEGTLDEADIAAKRIIEMTIRVYGPQSRETASALNNLGIVQHRNGQYDAAIQNFSSAVEIIEVAEDRLNSALVNPLKGLGAAQLSNGRPDRAKTTFTRAAHVTQVNDGPHNVAQIEILESIAETNIRMGDSKAARKILDRIHIINVRHFEKDPLGLLPSLMTRAKWQHRAGYYADERTTYRRAIRIIESTGGRNDPMLIEPLRRLGESFYFVDLTMSTPHQQGTISTGEAYFKRAVRIAEKAEATDWRESTKSRIALADYYTFIDQSNRSRRIYQDTWKLLSTDEERIAVRDELFSNPVSIRSGQLPMFADGGASVETTQENFLTGKIVVDYDVTVRGRVRKLRTEATPPEFDDMQRMVHREIRRRIFRPRLAEGAPVSTEKLVYVHEFSYLQSDLDARIAANAEASSQDDG